MVQYAGWEFLATVKEWICSCLKQVQKCCRLFALPAPSHLVSIIPGSSANLGRPKDQPNSKSPTTSHMLIESEHCVMSAHRSAAVRTIREAHRQHKQAACSMKVHPRPGQTNQSVQRLECTLSHAYRKVSMRSEQQHATPMLRMLPEHL